MLLETVKRILEPHGGRDGWFQTGVDGVHIIQLSENLPSNGSVYKPSLCITLQGAKQVAVGNETFDYGEMAFLLVAVAIPAFGRLTQASKERPFIGLTIELDVAMLREVVEELQDAPVPKDDRGIGVFTCPLQGELADTVLRLAKILDQPGAMQVLRPALMRELSYWLLEGPYGSEICKLVLPQTHLHRVADAIFVLRANYARTVRMEELAAAARMGLSSFHQHFKSLTAMTPLQYQKQLRLLEARRLMAAEEATVSTAAFEVGYESVSQFSREYSRLFGISPKQDSRALRSLLEGFAGGSQMRRSTESLVANAA
jgi:AraC-like DNA-binding protein